MPERLNQASALLRPLAGTLLVVCLAILGMAVLLLLAEARNLPAHVLLYNPAYLFQFWPYAGLTLHLGVFAMGGAGAICCFAALHAGRERTILIAAGIFSFALAADDFFMLHQHFWPKRGVPPTAIYAVYALLAGGGAVAFRRQLRSGGNLAVWIALLLMAGSLGADRVGSGSLPGLILEDTLKFAGFCLWASFWIVRAHSAVSQNVQFDAVQVGSVASERAANWSNASSASAAARMTEPPPR